MNIAPPTVAASRRTRRTVLSVAVAIVATFPIAAGASGASDETTAADTTESTVPAASPPEATTDALEPTTETSAIWGPRLTFTVPDGWDNWEWFVATSKSEPAAGVMFFVVDNIFADPCQWVELSPPPGPSVDDLAAAIADVPALNATAATDITVDGFHGKEIEFTIPDYDEDECIDRRFGLFQESGSSTWGPSYWARAPRQYLRLWILDVDGIRLVIATTYYPDTPQQDLDDLDTVLNSIQIDVVEPESGDAAETSVAPGTGSADRLTARPAGTTGASLGFYEYLPSGYDDDGSSPLLVFLHGYDESGDGSADDLALLLANGIPQLIGTDVWPSERPFVVLAPQHALPPEGPLYASCDDVVVHVGSCAMPIQHELGHPENGSICTTPAEIHDFLSYAIASYGVDPDRVYLTGLSCGAFGAWEYVAEYGGTQIAAMVPIAGEGRPAWEAATCRLGEVGIWAFHGDADDIVAPAGSIETMTNLAACPTPRRDAELTVYPGADHDSWTRTYDGSAGHDIYEWLLGFTVP